MPVAFVDLQAQHDGPRLGPVPGQHDDRIGQWTAGQGVGRDGLGQPEQDAWVGVGIGSCDEGPDRLDAV